MSLMVIHSLRNGSEEDAKRLKEILKMKTKDKELIDEAISIMKKNGSINYAINKADTLIKDAWDGVKNYIPNNKFKGYLKALAEFFVNRNK